MSQRTNGREISVSVGVPVRNGARFLAETLDSLLAQSYADFELLISDNASTDETPEIGRAYAARDPRVRYLRSDVDLGLAGNYNRLFHEARGKYFKWAAADDLHEPDYLKCCVEVLDRDPSVVLAYGKSRFIDENGKPVEETDPGFDLQDESAHERLRYVIRSKRWVNAIFGLVRAEALGRTPLLPKYPSGDYIILGELALLGKFVEVPEVLFLRRLHPGASSQNLNDANWLAHFWNAGNSGVDGRLVLWSRSRGHAGTIMRSGLSVGEKVSLSGSLLRTMVTRRRRLFAELRSKMFS
jgi:glycosyltransferase involved in cell wall biosynthesis